MSGRAQTAIAALAAGSALAACGSAERPAPRPGAPSDRATTRQEARLLDKAQHILVRRCMVRQGFQLWISAGRTWPRARAFPYVVDDVAWARKHGYGSDIERRLEALKRQHPNRRYVERLPSEQQKAYRRALYGDGPGSSGVIQVTLPTGGAVGTSTDGCLSEAQRELYGDLAAWFRASTVTDNLAGTRAGRVAQDPRFLAGVRRWSRCMHAGGHPYADPGEARAAVPAAKRQRTRTIETRIAAAEATCAVRTGLSATANSLDRRYAAAMNKEYRTEIATRRHMELAALPRARAVTGSG